MGGGAKLSQLRRRIDAIDSKLLALLNRRSSLAVAIGRLKKRQSLPVFDSRREKAVLSRLIQGHRGPLARSAITSIFKEILRHNRTLQR